MKKFLSILMVALILVPCCLLFTGCSAEGKYTASELTFNNVTITRRQYNKTYGKDNFDYENATAGEMLNARVYVLYFSRKINLKSDGTAIITYDFPKWVKDNNLYSAEETTLTWSEEGDIVKISLREFKKDGRKLTSKDGVGVVFKKSLFS